MSDSEPEKEKLEDEARKLRERLVPINPGPAILKLWNSRGGDRKASAKRAPPHLASKPVPLDSWVANQGLKFGGDISREDPKCLYKAMSRACPSIESGLRLSNR